MLAASENKINVLLGKYKLLTHLEKIHRLDSVEAMLGSDACFAGFNKNVTYVTS